MPGPILEVGERVVLRTVERDDAEFVQRFYTDPWAREGLHANSHKSRAEVEDEIEEELESDDNAAYLACVDGEDAPYGHPGEDETTPVAFVVFHHVDRDRPGLVHWVAPEYRGEGYGEEALDLAIETVFRTYDAHSVGATVLSGDDDARERVEALGFREEGRGREMHWVEGAYRDAIQYGLLRREWEGDADGGGGD